MSDLKPLLPCPFCGKAMMLRGALWPSEGDRDAVIHAEPTDCPLYDFSNDTADESIIEVWNRRAAVSQEPAPVAWRYRYNGQWYLSQSKGFAKQGFDLQPLFAAPVPPVVGEDALPVSSVAMQVRDVHPDDIAVDRFAVAMKEKLAKKRAEGRGGWDSHEECSAEYLSYLLVQHIRKGDPLDVGNLAMMLHQRGDRIVIDEETAAIFPKSATAQPAQGWRPIETAPNGQEVLIAYWRWRNSMSPGTIIVQSAMRTEIHGPGIWSWVVSDNKHGPFPIRGWSDGDIIGWMPLPSAPAPVGGAK